MGLFDFPANLLGQDEDLVLDARPHWISLLVPIAQTTGIGLALAAGYLLAPFDWGSLAFAAMLVVALVAFLVWPGPLITAWLTAHFVVTTDRVIRRSGLFAKQAVEISFERISDVQFHQSVIERLIGAGDLTIQSAAGELNFEDVRYPEAVQRLIFERKELNDAHRREAERRAFMADFWAPSSVADELDKLHRLRTTGVISDEEFEDLKTRLMHRVRTAR